MKPSFYISITDDITGEKFDWLDRFFSTPCSYGEMDRFESYCTIARRLELGVKLATLSRFGVVM